VATDPMGKSTTAKSEIRTYAGPTHAGSPGLADFHKPIRRRTLRTLRGAACLTPYCEPRGVGRDMPVRLPWRSPSTSLVEVREGMCSTGLGPLLIGSSAAGRPSPSCPSKYQANVEQLAARDEDRIYRLILEILTVE